MRPIARAWWEYPPPGLLLLLALVAVPALKDERVPASVVAFSCVLAFVVAAEVASSALMLRARASSTN